MSQVSFFGFIRTWLTLIFLNMHWLLKGYRNHFFERIYKIIWIFMVNSSILLYIFVISSEVAWLMCLKCGMSLPFISAQFYLTLKYTPSRNHNLCIFFVLMVFSHNRVVFIHWDMSSVKVKLIYKALIDIKNLMIMIQ